MTIMTVDVRYHAHIRKAAGRAGERVEIEEGATAQDLVRILADRHGEPLRGLLMEDERPRPGNLLVVGDAQVRWDAPRALVDGDVVSILPPISGGS